MSGTHVLTTVTVTPAQVRAGDLVRCEGSWRTIRDLRRTGRGGRAAVINGLPGVWKLPSTFDVMRPARRS